MTEPALPAELGPVVPPAALGPVGTAAAYALVLVLTLLLAVWGAFLVPLRIGGTLAPLCWVIAVVGNTLLGRAGGRLLGRSGALGTGLLWLAIAFTLGSTRREGDLIVPGTTVGLGFLLLGAVGSAVAYAVAGKRATS